MSQPLSYEDAVDLPQADRKLVHERSLGHEATSDGAPWEAKRTLRTLAG